MSNDEAALRKLNSTIARSRTYGAKKAGTTRASVSQTKRNASSALRAAAGTKVTQTGRKVARPMESIFGQPISVNRKKLNQAKGISLP